ncbi:hypothetical protein B7L44_15185 [Acinetobacter nosocomialis]|nr:hypothetical protein B7L44_15185 [Acinetobacter nosocomialis]
MFITSFEEQNITYRSCSNLRIHLSTSYTKISIFDFLISVTKCSINFLVLYKHQFICLFINQLMFLRALFI